ncbi:nucleotidyltransferase domain-containing protein [Pseudoclavibacter sp. CFCC 13796]|uniref:nucleotidyltransferase domain-containing protein n=1 Tax=Pseudoclavibacter sp. CFCC 13796 TaxID=2615179 RepID=UPI00178888DE|nr:nucleotidyltransferase domain-containing protein [Pseudoclavibacter sp. CFCC 13796]
MIPSTQHIVDLIAKQRALPDLQPGVILQTVHGSRLYGLQHPGSDYDFSLVVDRRMPRPLHIIRADVDVTVVSVDEFMAQVFRGVPQALEALYSASAQITDAWAPFLRRWRSTGTLVRSTFRRTQAAFRRDRVTSKRLIHARRLQIEAAQIESCGRLRPELTATEIAWVLGATTADMRMPPQLPEEINPARNPA